MDVLGDYVIRLDSDQGKLMILRSPGVAVGVALPLTYSWNAPLIKLEMPHLGIQDFMIDTGCVSRDSGLIDLSTFDHSVLSGVGKLAATSLFADATGTRVSRLVLFEKLVIGDFECHKIAMGEAKKLRLLSVRFLTRFNVTFDFPRSLIYLEKSRYFSRPDRCDLSGLHFLRRNGHARRGR